MSTIDERDPVGTKHWNRDSNISIRVFIVMKICDKMSSITKDFRVI